MRPPILALVSLACVLLSACGPKVAIMGTRPAEVGLPGVKSLYVMEFDGDYGFEARRCLLAELSGSDRFAVYDQEIDERPQEAWADVRGSARGTVNDQRGYDTVQYSDVRYEYVTYRDKTGLSHTYEREIEEWKSERVAYVNRTEEVAVTVSVEHAARGFLDEKSGSRSKHTKFGGAQTHPRSTSYRSSAPKLSDMNASTGLGLNAYACEIGTKLAKRLIPKPYSINVSLADGGGELVAAGAEQAEKGNWPAAEQAWQQALAADPNNAAALYNLGVACEHRGGAQMQQAKEYYQRARALDEGSIYADGVERINERMVEAEELQRQLAD